MSDDKYLENSFMDITDKRNQIQSKHQQKFTLVNKDNVPFFYSEKSFRKT
jgi:hypothetical protein